MRTETKTLIAAMRNLAATIQSEDGVANAAIAEAAERLAELHAEKAAIVAELDRLGTIWRERIEEDAQAGTIAAQAFSSGIASGLSLAIRVVHAGGALPPEEKSTYRKG